MADPSRDWMTVYLLKGARMCPLWVTMSEIPPLQHSSFSESIRMWPQNPSVIIPMYESVLQPTAFGTIPKSNFEKRKDLSLPVRGSGH